MEKKVVGVCLWRSLCSLVVFSHTACNTSGEREQQLSVLSSHQRAHLIHLRATTTTTTLGLRYNLVE